jgi:hypothetical protein
MAPRGSAFPWNHLEGAAMKKILFRDDCKIHVGRDCHVPPLKTEQRRRDVAVPPYNKSQHFFEFCNYFFLFGIFLLMVSCLSPGCRRHVNKPAPRVSTVQIPSPDSPLAVDPDQVSRQVLERVPNQGQLKAVRARGVLRVALPAEERPFQYRHHELNNRPMGFNVALASQMARAFGLRPDIVILTNEQIESLRQGGKPADFDIIFRTPGMIPCPGDRSLKYFYQKEGKQWLTICVAGEDDSLKQAVETILSFFVETGVFAYLYSEYF